MKLYEIDEAIERCIDAETGEIIDMEALTRLQMERDRKLEGVACWVKNLEAEAAALKAEAVKLSMRQKAAENKAESLKEWLTFALEGGTFKTPRCVVTYRRSNAVVIEDEKAFAAYAAKRHKDWLTFSDPKPNKTAIKAALQNGLKVKGAALVERQNMQIK